MAIAERNWYVALISIAVRLFPPASSAAPGAPAGQYALPAAASPTQSAKVAQVMKTKDVGPIPIVENGQSRKLIGMVTDRDLADLPLEPNDANRLLMFDTPAWNVRFYHDRRWHLFHQTSDVALLRLLDKGGLIAQCNIKKVPDAAPGKHLSREQFQADIERALGNNFQEFVQAETLRLKEGLFVERVVAVGTCASYGGIPAAERRGPWPAYSSAQCAARAGQPMRRARPRGLHARARRFSSPSSATTPTARPGSTHSRRSRPR